MDKFFNYINPLIENFKIGMKLVGITIVAAIKGAVAGTLEWINGLITEIETYINNIILVINLFLAGFNKFVGAASKLTGDSWTDISPIQKIVITKLRIPALAQGAVIPPNSPFLAMLGDQKSGTNIETPLDTIKQAVAEVLASGGFGGNGDLIVPVIIDGREIARAVVKQNDIHKRSTGRSLF